MATLTPHEVAVRLESCAYDAVDHTGDQEIRRHGVVIGEIAWDDCQCGQLVVAEARRFGSRDFPLEEVDHQAECGEPWLVVVYTLSLVRCVPVPDGNGNAPSIADLTVAAAQQSEDMSKIRWAVMCCLDTAYDSHEVIAFALGAQEVVGPQGGCAGSELTVQVGWTQDCGC